MRFRKRGVILAILLTATPYIVAGESFSYRMTYEESIHQAWKTDVAPSVTISSSNRLKLHDKVKQKNLDISRAAVRLGVNEDNMADFCIDRPKEPVCREIIISDFSYKGLEGVLLGNRGERLSYIILAQCGQDSTTCRYPHLKLGPNPILHLLKEGIRAHTIEQEGETAVAAGPFPKEKALRLLPLIKKILPDAYLH